MSKWNSDELLQDWLSAQRQVLQILQPWKWPGSNVFAHWKYASEFGALPKTGLPLPRPLLRTQLGPPFEGAVRPGMWLQPAGLRPRVDVGSMQSTQRGQQSPEAGRTGARPSAKGLWPPPSSMGRYPTPQSTASAAPWRDFGEPMPDKFSIPTDLPE